MDTEYLVHNGVLGMKWGVRKKKHTPKLIKARKNPSGKEGQKIAYGISSMLGDAKYKEESKIVYNNFRSNNYNAIPDIHDILSGTSKNAIIIINPDKVKVTSTTLITKNIMKSSKKYVKSLEKKLYLSGENSIACCGDESRFLYCIMRIKNI